MPESTIPDVSFSDNTNQRTPCVLVLDGSGSMTGKSIRQLNEGLKQFEKELKDDPTTSLRVQVLVIRIGGHDEVDIVTDWTDAIDFTAPEIVANGSTPIGEGMATALDEVEMQKDVYDENGITSTRPWIILISDGVPTDHNWEYVAERCREAESDKRCVIFPVGTETADFDALDKFSNKTAKRLGGLQFSELFVWLSRSMTAVSSSVPGESVQLPATDDWETIEV